MSNEVRRTPPASYGEAVARIEQMAAREEKLTGALRSVREQVERMKDEPLTYGSVARVTDEQARKVDVYVGAQRLRLTAAPGIDMSAFTPGAEVALTEEKIIVDVGEAPPVGELALAKQVLDDGRLIITTGADQDRVVVPAATLDEADVKSGDSLRVDTRLGVAFEVVDRSDVQSLILEEVPDVQYADIGGLANQVEEIRDAVELPYLQAALFKEYDLEPPKGVLLYGPPGCGKTLIAKAVANSLGQRAAEQRGEDPSKGRAYFLNIKGPELLNKYVGETERQIREVFQKAREKASEGFPVIIFFDEMDSMFRTRGSGISSDVESTIVPQLLTEIDGVESAGNVLFIGATNRPDSLDPAVIRPGRIDVKIQIQRPDEEGARDIFSKYISTKLPIHDDEVAAYGSKEAAVQGFIDQTVNWLFSKSEETQFLEATFSDGKKQTLYFSDFLSGAMIANIVAKAKKAAVKSVIETGENGLRAEQFIDACRTEFQENEDLPNTSNPDDWARISGQSGGRVVNLRMLTREPAKAPDTRPIDTASNTGQYL